MRWLCEDFPGGGTALGERNLTLGENIVPTDDFYVHITLEPVPDLAWFEAVRIEGPAAEPSETENYKNGWLSFRVKEGEAGDSMTLTLPPVAGIEKPVYTFKRIVTPSAKAEAEVNGKWEAVRSDRVYPEQNLRLRYTFSQPMDRGSVERSLRNPTVGPRHPLTDTATFTWLDEQTLTVEWATGPSVLNWSLAGSKDQNGVFLVGPVPGVHTGRAPYLAAVDPASGKEQSLREMMPQAVGARTTGDGQRLMVEAYDLVSGQYSFNRLRTWVLDLQAGTTQSSLWEPQTYFIRNTGALTQIKMPADPLSEASHLSPDGSKLIRAVEQPVRVLAGKYGYGRADLVWAPGGKSFAATSAVDKDTTEVVRFDAQTGAATPVAKVPSYSLLYAPPLTMQWEGGRILAGRAVVDVAGEKVLRTVDGMAGVRCLSRDGKYLMFAKESGYNSGDWGPVKIVAVDSATTVNAGEGLPAGWSADGRALIIRWDGYKYRYQPPGL